jgi:hypothetical protein
MMAIENSVTGNDHTIIQMAMNIFTFTFFAEAILKIMSLGIKGYFKDTMNLFDAILVVFSLLEFFLFSENTSGISALRVLRIFRILRVTRVIRGLKYMRIIIRVLGNTIGSAMYIALLLLLFIFIYCLLGMQVYGQ